MSTKTRIVSGWTVIGFALLLAVLTVPVWQVHGSATNGSVRVDSDPFSTTVEGKGQFTHAAYWSISWPMALVCAAMLGGGVALLRGGKPLSPA